MHHLVNDAELLMQGGQLDQTCRLDRCWIFHERARVAFASAAGHRRAHTLPGTHVELQTGHKDFEHDKDKSTDLFAIATWSEGTFLCLITLTSIRVFPCGRK